MHADLPGNRRHPARAVAAAHYNYNPVSYDLLHQCLHSDDPRLIAWAADLAHRTHDPRIIAEMPALLEQWAIPQAIGEWRIAGQPEACSRSCPGHAHTGERPGPRSSNRRGCRILPQPGCHTDQPYTAIERTFDPWQLDLRSDRSWSRRTLARIASMMLAKDPGPSHSGFLLSHDHGGGGFMASIDSPVKLLLLPVSQKPPQHDQLARVITRVVRRQQCFMEQCLFVIGPRDDIVQIAMRIGDQLLECLQICL